MPETPVIKDRHLGDGVYASFNGYQIVLDLRGQDDTTRIVLEPDVFYQLKQFAKDLHDKWHEFAKQQRECDE